MLLEELEKLKRQPVIKDELAKGKNQLLSEVFRSVDNHFTFSRILTDLEMEFEDEKALLQYMDRIKILIEQEITEIANRHFQEDNYASAITIPKTARKQKPRLARLFETLINIQMLYPP